MGTKQAYNKSVPVTCHRNYVYEFKKRSDEHVVELYYIIHSTYIYWTLIVCQERSNGLNSQQLNWFNCHYSELSQMRKEAKNDWMPTVTN